MFTKYLKYKNKYELEKTGSSDIVVIIRGSIPTAYYAPPEAGYEFGIEPVDGYSGFTALIRVEGQSSTTQVRNGQEAVTAANGASAQILKFYNQSSTKVATFEFIPNKKKYPIVVDNGSLVENIKLYPGMGYRIYQSQTYTYADTQA